MKIKSLLLQSIFFTCIYINFAYAEYPDKTVRIVVGFSPGGGSDVIARVIAQRLSDSLKANVIVENRPGAGGMLAAELIANAPPDGYHLLLGTSAEMTISPPLYGRASYKPASDFIPISLLGLSPAILVANPNFPAKDIRDVIAEAKKNPGKVTIASGGAGTAPHLAAEQLKVVGGVDFVIAQYKGAGPSQTDAIAGHVPLVFTTIASALPAIKAKQLKPLTVISQKRSTLLPEVMFTGELGFKNYSAITWFGLFSPANTPKYILDKLRNVINQSLSDSELRSRFEAMGIEPASAEEGGEALRQRVIDELANWSRLIKDAGIKSE